MAEKTKKTEEAAVAVPTRTSTIRKTITRKYNTAKYETMDITVELNSEVEWDSIENLKIKSNNITTLVIQDFDQTAKRVMDELKVTSFAASMTVAEPARRSLTAEEKQDYDKLN